MDAAERRLPVTATAIAVAVAAGVTALGAGGTAVALPGQEEARASLVAPAPLEAAMVTNVALKRVAGGLQQPVAVVGATDGSNRVLVAERRGVVRVVEGTRVTAKPFIDLRKQVGSFSTIRVGAREVAGTGGGMLGMALHPKFKSNGFVFVSYTDADGDLRISRLTASGAPGAAATHAAASTEKVVLEVARAKQRLQAKRPAPKGQVRVTASTAENNSGQLSFGPDGFLYIGVGDSGGVGDPGDSAQDRASLRGKILRIDVNTAEPTASGPTVRGQVQRLAYAIPAGNPFAKAAAFRPELWVIGLRDPRGLSFDRRDGHLWVADVGQDQRQEVNRIRGGQPGVNLGWDCVEGTVDVSARHGGAYCAARKAEFQGPIWNHQHSPGRCAVVGGVVYRGQRFAKQLGGRYLYADHCSGELWAISQGPRFLFRSVQVGKHQGITAFGEDASGEVLVTTADGWLHRLSVNGVTDTGPAAKPAAKPVSKSALPPLPTVTVPAPTLPAPTLPTPTLPAPTLPAPTLPTPTVPSPSVTVPAPTVTTPTLPPTTLPVAQADPGR